MIPRIDAAAMAQGDAATMADVAEAATGVGFMVVENTELAAERVQEAIEAYRAFFKRPEAEKARVDMARTGSNRGWGAAGSEQVDPNANPDFKQVFDCGYQVHPAHPYAGETVYAPNVWPDNVPEFQRIISAYYDDA